MFRVNKSRAQTVQHRTRNRLKWLYKARENQGKIGEL